LDNLVLYSGRRVGARGTAFWRVLLRHIGDDGVRRRDAAMGGQLVALSLARALPPSVRRSPSLDRSFINGARRLNSDRNSATFR